MKAFAFRLDDAESHQLDESLDLIAQCFPSMTREDCLRAVVRSGVIQLQRIVEKHHTHEVARHG